MLRRSPGRFYGYRRDTHSCLTSTRVVELPPPAATSEVRNRHPLTTLAAGSFRVHAAATGRHTRAGERSGCLRRHGPWLRLRTFRTPPAALPLLPAVAGIPMHAAVVIHKHIVGTTGVRPRRAHRRRPSTGARPNRLCGAWADPIMSGTVVDVAARTGPGMRSRIRTGTDWPIRRTP